MELTDLRDYLEILEEYGELQRVQTEVDWNLGDGSNHAPMLRSGGSGRAFRERKRLSKRVPRSRCTTARSQSASEAFLVCAYRLALRLPPHASAKEIMQTYLERKEKLTPPVRVNTGPCKENIILGDDVDALKFPIPLIHGGDGGRYIGTWHTRHHQGSGQLVGQLGHVSFDGP